MINGNAVPDDASLADQDHPSGSVSAPRAAAINAAPTQQPLSTLPLRRPARVVAILREGHDDIGDRLLEIGFEEGAVVELIHRGPLGGDPLAFRLGRTRVALRRSLAERVLVVTED